MRSYLKRSMNWILATILVAGLVGGSFLGVADARKKKRKPVTTHFVALMNGTQQVPPVDEESTGLVYMSLTPAGVFCYHLTYSGLVALESDAHFHPGKPGENGPPILDLPDGVNPKHDCLDQNELSAAVAASGPGWTLADFTSRLKRNELYVNVHSATYPAGEIRGQVVRTN